MAGKAAGIFTEVTGKNVGHAMAGLVWGVAVTAPFLRESLGGKAIFTKGPAGFERRDLEGLVRALRAGPPAVRVRLNDWGLYREKSGPGRGGSIPGRGNWP